MNRLIFIFAAGASVALLSPQTVGARGTGGMHTNEQHRNEPQRNEPQHDDAQRNQQQRNEPRPDNQHSGNLQSGYAHSNQPQMSSHGENVPLPTDAGFGQSSHGKAATGYAASEHEQPTASGAGGAAAGHAAAEHNQPPVSGAGGAAAGAAAANRNAPQYSGAQGAAAGAAAANRNQPKYSGAEGAAAGAAAANRNAPQHSGAQGAAAGYAASEQNQPQVSGAGGVAAGYAAAAHRTTAVPDSVAAARGAAVRNTYNGHDVPAGAWSPTGWTAGQAWNAATWPAIGTSLGWAAGTQPTVYNYGTNITYQDNQVYYGNQQVATADEYYQQASTLAQSAPPPDSKATDWMPLGVFALVQNDQAEPHYVMQLAVNKAGTLAGNYSDLVSGTTLPIQGAVDKKSQRVAWTVGNNKNTVGETGIYNLTQNEAHVLLHIGKDKTQQWMLVRLKQPEHAGNAK